MMTIILILPILALISGIVYASISFWKLMHETTPCKDGSTENQTTPAQSLVPISVSHEETSLDEKALREALVPFLQELIDFNMDKISTANIHYHYIITNMYGSEKTRLNNLFYDVIDESQKAVDSEMLILKRYSLLVQTGLSQEKRQSIKDSLSHQDGLSFDFNDLKMSNSKETYSW